MFKTIWQWLKDLYRQWFWRSQNWLNYGDQKRRLGEWENAISAYDHAIKLEPNNYLSWRKKGYILAEMDKNEEALSCYEKAVRFKQNDPDIWCEKGDILTKLKRHQFAISAYSSALEFNPQLVSAWIAQGNLLLEIQQEESAVQCYEQVLIHEPNNQEIRKKRDELIEQINQEKKIEKLFSQVEEYYKQKDYEKVVNIYEEILQIKSNYELGWDHLGYALLELGEYERALNSLNKALNIRQDHAEVWYFKGRTLENMGEFAEALICYNKVLRLDKKYYQAWDGRAINLSKLEQQEQPKKTEENLAENLEENLEENSEENLQEDANESWQKAFEINPNYYQGWLNQGLILLEQGKYTEAKINFDKALELNRNYYHGWLCQARLEADFGRYQKALDIWDKIFESKAPKTKYLDNRVLINIDLETEILNYAIKIYKSLLDKITIYSQKKREIVNQLLDKVLTLNPQSAKAWWYKAKGLKYAVDLRHLERDKLRVNCYFKALLYFDKNDPDYPELYQEHLFVKNNFACELYQEAEDNIKIGKFEEAIQQLTESIKIFEDLKEHKDIVNSYRLRGKLYSQLERYQEAINDFDQALLSSGNTDYLTYCERGATYELLDDFTKAIEDYSLAIEIKPNFESYNSRGLLYNKQEKFELAIEDFTEAINLNPSDPNCMYSRGCAKVQLGQIEEAIDDLLQASELYKIDDNIEAYQLVVNFVEQLQSS